MRLIWFLQNIQLPIQLHSSDFQNDTTIYFFGAMQKSTNPHTNLVYFKCFCITSNKNIASFWKSLAQNLILLPKKVNTAPSTPLHKTFFIQTSQRQNKNQKILAKNKVSCIERNSKCTFLKRWIKGLKIEIKQLLNHGN